MNILMVKGIFLSDTTCDFTFPNLILFCNVQSETMEKENNKLFGTHGFFVYPSTTIPILNCH